jgi:hypothetical protein
MISETWFRTNRVGKEVIRRLQQNHGDNHDEAIARLVAESLRNRIDAGGFRKEGEPLRELENYDTGRIELTITMELSPDFGAKSRVMRSSCHGHLNEAADEIIQRLLPEYGDTRESAILRVAAIYLLDRLGLTAAPSPRS